MAKLDEKFVLNQINIDNPIKGYKGHTKIELKDEKTGEVETVEYDNMITNAVKNLFEKNPFGAVRYAAAYNDADRVKFNAPLPLMNNFCSVMCFEDAIEENANNFVIDKIPTAYAGARTNETSGASKRGSMNASQSGPIDGGYQFVWDFTSEQGNGKISSVCLAPYSAGVGKDFTLFDSSDTSGALFSPTDGGNVLYAQNIDAANYQDYADYICGAVYLDEKNNKLYKLVINSDGKSGIIRKCTRKIYEPGLGQKNFYDSDGYKTANYYIKDKEEITVYFETAIPTLTANNIVSVNWYDGKIYVIVVTNNTNKFTYYTIDPSSGSVTEKTEEVANALFYTNSSLAGGSYNRGVWLNLFPLMGGYLYLWNINSINTNNTISYYKIKLADTTDVSILTSDITHSTGLLFSCPNVTFHDKNVFYSRSHAIIDDKICPVLTGAQYMPNYQGMATYDTEKTGAHSLAGGVYVLIDYYAYNSMTDKGVRQQSVLRNNMILTTINNLGTPVEKDSSKSMKITYTITEVEN